MMEERTTYWEVWNEAADCSDYFDSEQEAYYCYRKLVAEGAYCVHLHVSNELWVDGEPTGEFDDELCLENSAAPDRGVGHVF